jgi:hypothetical protein
LSEAGLRELTRKKSERMYPVGALTTKVRQGKMICNIASRMERIDGRGSLSCKTVLRFKSESAEKSVAFSFIVAELT